ncbi:Hypothetical predicted protein [Prunus dulcis]|uniref:Uncharacterized protein n=1 Tax=Prunus dulcis TaxID=3755 RepID=A0A5E4GEP7_PRUDU|nr:hypothetical protein L3X38_040905 [Prunus dulcis]VVA37998.1 Hypothetical predicted protein [Prunus dulcis]
MVVKAKSGMAISDLILTSTNDLDRVRNVFSVDEFLALGFYSNGLKLQGAGLTSHHFFYHVAWRFSEDGAREIPFPSQFLQFYLVETLKAKEQCPSLTLLKVLGST